MKIIKSIKYIFCILFLYCCNSENLEYNFVYSNVKNIDLKPKKIEYNKIKFHGYQMCIKGWQHTASFDSSAILIKGDIFRHNDTIFLKERNMVSPFIVWTNPNNEVTYYLNMIIPYKTPIDDYNDTWEHPDVYKVIRFPIRLLNNDTIQYLKVKIQGSGHVPYLGMRISKSKGIEGLFLCSEDFEDRKSSKPYTTQEIFYPNGIVLEKDTNISIGRPQFE